MSIETFGDRVRRFREKALMTQQELAAAAKIRPSTLADIENQHRKSSRHVAAIAAALNVAPRLLLTGEDGTPADTPPAQTGYWPFTKISPEDINQLDKIERSHIEQAIRDALEEVKTERRRHRRTG